MCDCCASANQVVLYHQSPRPGRECCTLMPLTQTWRSCDGGTTARAITTLSSCHHHTSTQEVVRTMSPACCELENGSGRCNNYGFCPSWSPSSSNQRTRIEALLGELLDRCIEDGTTCDCVCERYREHCTTCEQDQQALVCELMDLLERVRGGGRSSSSCGWQGRSPPGGRGCCIEVERERGREIKTETQSLFEVLIRTTRRKTYRSRSSSRYRNVVFRGRRGDGGLQRIVRQLLDELEGGAACDCLGCHEYFEVNLRKIKRALREPDGGECGSGEARCACGLGGGGGGSCYCCSGCSGVSTEIIRDRPPRRSRSGNVHVGWNLR